MEFRELSVRPNIDHDKKLKEKYIGFTKLISELKKRDIPVAILNSVNQDIENINSFSGSDKELLKLLSKKQSGILKLIEKELNLVAKNHYRNIWLSIGMSAIGLPIGTLIGLSVGNMGLLAVGLPIGMGIGIAIGIAIDKKASKTGSQLDIEIK